MRLQLNWIECQTTNLKVASSILAGRTNIREIAQLGSAPGLGPGGRRFESCFPDHDYFITLVMWIQIQVKRFFKNLNSLHGAVAHLGEHLLCKQGVESSILFSSTMFILWLCSSVGQSGRFIPDRSGVRPPPQLPYLFLQNWTLSSTVRALVS